jgi:hypothetical protein
MKVIGTAMVWSDGEVLELNEKGDFKFRALQNWRRESAARRTLIMMCLIFMD